MNFTYAHADLSTTIKNYTRNGNYYKIEYLDGTFKEYVSEDNEEEKNILNTMTKQAIDRQEQMTIKDADNSIFISSAGTILFTAASFTLLQESQYVFSAITAAAMLTAGAITTECIKTKYELQKYKMFLEMANKMTHEELDQNWSRFIGKDKIYDAPININTLDKKSYSLVKSFYKKYNSNK